MKLSQIKKLVEEFSGVDIEVENRREEFKVPRFIYFYMARKYTKRKYADIGGLVDRTHATVIHGERQYHSEMLHSEEYSNLSNAIEEHILKNTTSKEIPRIKLMKTNYYDKKHSKKVAEIKRLEIELAAAKETREILKREDRIVRRRHVRKDLNTLVSL